MPGRPGHRRPPSSVVYLLFAARERRTTCLGAFQRRRVVRENESGFQGQSPGQTARAKSERGSRTKDDLPGCLPEQASRPRERVGVPGAKPPDRPRERRASAARERRTTCLGAFQRRRVVRESESGFQGQSPQTDRASEERARLANEGRLAWVPSRGGESSERASRGSRGKAPGSINGEVAEWPKAAVC
jgi:hypothetical protein